MGTHYRLGNSSNFSRFQIIASLQLRNLGRAGVEADVAVWWPLTLRISSERYVVRPRQKRQERRFPEACRPGWRMPHRSMVNYTKIPLPEKAESEPDRAAGSSRGGSPSRCGRHGARLYSPLGKRLPQLGRFEPAILAARLSFDILCVVVAGQVPCGKRPQIS